MVHVHATSDQRLFSAIIPHYDVIVALDEIRGWSLGGWLSGLGGSMFSQIVQIALPIVLSIIMLNVVIQLYLCVLEE